MRRESRPPRAVPSAHPPRSSACLERRRGARRVVPESSQGRGGGRQLDHRPPTETVKRAKPSVNGRTRRESSNVPDRYRGLITAAALECSSDNVTAALIAGILKEESDFNATFSDPATASYGIAGWTPSVFDAWIP